MHVKDYKRAQDVMRRHDKKQVYVMPDGRIYLKKPATEGYEIVKRQKSDNNE